MFDITKLILIALICNDHILLEDVPGTGKTMLTNTIAQILDLEFRRVQGTPDLLPTDLTGVNIYSQKDHEFHFMPGPIFTNILLFDEINRTSPKTQSALLEAMAEAQVSIEHETYQFEKPFFVIATQNPVEHLGTYPLPQAQLDRFLIKTSIGYPSPELEAKIMMADDMSRSKVKLPQLKRATISTWQKEYQNVYVDESLVGNLLTIIHQTREPQNFKLGISPRAARKFIRALQASAYLHERDFVTKDDIFDLFLPVMAHRVFATTPGTERSKLEQMLNAMRW